MKFLALFASAALLYAQTEVDKAVAELSQITGLPALRKVQFDTINKDQFRKYLEQTIKEEVKPDEIRIQELVLKRFGLVPSDYKLMESTVDLLIEQAAAFYDYRRKKLFLMEGGDPAGLPMLMIHELAHALADQHFNLGKYLKRGSNDDATLARMAVMEGQATWLMMESAARKIGQSMRSVPGMASRMEGAADQLGGQFPVLLSAPLYVRESLLFPYRAGFRFQHELLGKLGDGAFARVFTSPPLSTQQVLHPEKYLAGTKPVDVPLPSFPSKDYRELATGTVGEFDHAIMLEQYTDKKIASALAPKWRGGSFRLMEHKQDKQIVLLYASDWSDATSAREMFSAYRAIAKGKSKLFSVVSDSENFVEATGDDGPIRIELMGARVTAVEGASSATLKN